MNIFTLIAIALFVSSLGQIAAALGVYLRIAIPRSPVRFRVVLIPGMLVMAAMAQVLGGMLLSGTDVLFGLHLLTYALVYFCGSGTVWWGFVSYTLYHYRRGRRCPV